MQSEAIIHFAWPNINFTLSIAALVLALAIFVFGLFSGVKANKVRIIFAIIISTVIGWLIMPLAIKAGTVLHMADSQTGIVIIITVMMLAVAAIATSVYEIITVTFPDIGMASKK